MFQTHCSEVLNHGCLLNGTIYSLPFHKTLIPNTPWRTSFATRAATWRIWCARCHYVTNGVAFCQISSALVGMLQWIVRIEQCAPVSLDLCLVFMWVAVYSLRLTVVFCWQERWFCVYVSVTLFELTVVNNWWIIMVSCFHSRPSITTDFSDSFVWSAGVACGLWKSHVVIWSCSCFSLVAPWVVAVRRHTWDIVWRHTDVAWSRSSHDLKTWRLAPQNYCLVETWPYLAWNWKYIAATLS